MTHTYQFPQVLEGQPAVFERDWLPEGLWPEVDELRQEHIRVLDDYNAASHALANLPGEFEREDAERRKAFHEGTEAPEVTPTAERQDKRLELLAKFQAATDRLADFVERAAQVFTDSEEAWQDKLTAQEADAEDEIRKAREAVLAAETRLGEIERARKWVDRSVRPKAGSYTSWDVISAPRPKTDLERAAAVLDGDTGELTHA